MRIALLPVLVICTLLLRCTPVGPGGAAAPGIVVNEFMAANGDGGPTDEHGDPDDWVELFNTSDAVIDLQGYYLSDDSLQLHAYSLPDTQLPPGGYLLIWADDEPDEGSRHAPFKFSWQNGDEIILTQGKNLIVDRYRFFPENGNPLARVPGTSFGRTADGDTTWGQQLEPTPGSANTGIRRPKTD